MKFLQGIPIVGAVGSAYDVVYLKKITEYAKLKNKRRVLLKRKRDNFVKTYFIDMLKQGEYNNFEQYVIFKTLPAREYTEWGMRSKEVLI